MASYWDKSVYCSPLGEVLSLDNLIDDTRAGHAGGGPSVLDIPDPAVDPSRDLERRQSEEALDLFIFNLPNDDRSLVTRHFIDGESQADIGRSEQVSRMAICKRLKRILVQGRATLAPYYDCALA
jgi:DNA-directed RNA polymerase specialized sigma24 family protein